ncbi:MAG: cupin domain-containing protein [bacterium]
MSEIKVEKPAQEKLKSLGVENWPVWECEPSAFDWEYDSNEDCYILEGSVTVKTGGGDVSFGKGDFVSFPRGLKCRWVVAEKVRKHYKFS